MSQHGKQTKAVIDDDDIAQEVLLSRHDHTSCVGRGDRCADRTLKITAAVRIPGLSVENATSAECADGAAWDWTHERTIPQASRGRHRPQTPELLCFASNPGLKLSRRSDKRRIDFQAPCRKAARTDHDCRVAL